MTYASDLAAGTWVICDDPDLWGGGSEIARTADGFCQFCGSTTHRPQNADEFEAPEADPAEADPAEAEPMCSCGKPAVMITARGIALCRTAAVVGGFRPSELPSSIACPLHGEGCEAWA